MERKHQRQHYWIFKCHTHKMHLKETRCHENLKLLKLNGLGRLQYFRNQ